MRIWRIGIAGTGMISDFHARAIESLPNARLAGFANIRAEGARVMAGKYGVKAFESISSMLQSDELDIVMIATPSGAHMEHAVEAARCGKHVLCEKPIEISLGRIDAMIEAHRKAGTCLGGIFNFRFEETTRIIREAVNAGRLGTITCASVHVPWWRSDAYYEGWHGTWQLDGGGAMMNQSIHMVDLLQYIMGAVESIAAFTSRLGHPQIETEDAAVSILKFKNQALGMIYGTTASFPGQFRRMEITGTKGTIVLVENSLQTWQFDEMKPGDEQIIREHGSIRSGSGVSDPKAISFVNHARNIASFIQSIEEGRKFEIDGEEARKSVSIILDIYRSAKEGKVIRRD